MKYMHTLFCIVCGTMLLGCGSLEQRSEEYNSSRANFYPGVSRDVELIEEDNIGIGIIPVLSFIFKPIYVIDMPLSFIVDTLCLPYDLWRAYHLVQPNNPE